MMSVYLTKHLELMVDIIERETLGIETYMVTYYTSMGFSNQKKKKKRANACLRSFSSVGVGAHEVTKPYKPDNNKKRTRRPSFVIRKYGKH